MADTILTPSIIEALQRADAYPHPVGTIELRETHISWVFLTGNYAYKIKKPVNFGFLDFSTVEKRRFYCEEEVRLNRRLAPDLYLDVVPICGDSISPHVGGQGQVLDYAVRMQQFDTRQGFDELLERGDLTPAHMDETARTLADFHARIAIADTSSPYGTPATIYIPVQENFEQIRQHLAAQIHDVNIHQQFTMLEEWSKSTFHTLESVLHNRKLAGFVRECHGDLHLRNIIYWQQKVIPFDCIEFNPNLRWIDVMSELAFLLMDLDDHQRPDLAQRLLNAYLEITGDYAGLQVLRFYQVYRALVRAKVASLRLTQTSGQDEDAVQEIGNYIRLAVRYTEPSQAKLFITHGLSGSGKTYVSQQLLEQTALIRVRSDVERKRLFGIPAKARSGSGLEQGIYQASASEATYARLLELAGQLLAWGFSVLVDAAFLKAGQRQQFQTFADRNRIPFAILHCEVAEDTQRQRILARSKKADDASEADLSILEQQLNTQDKLDQNERKKSFTIDTTQQADLETIIDWLETQG